MDGNRGRVGCEGDAGTGGSSRTLGRAGKGCGEGAETAVITKEVTPEGVERKDGEL